MQGKFVIVTVVVAALAVGAGWWLTRSSAVPPATAAQDAPAAAAAQTATTDPPLSPVAPSVAPRAPCQFHLADGFVYSGNLTMANAIRPRALMAAVLGSASRMGRLVKQPAVQHVQAGAAWKLHLRVARVAKDGTAILAARFVELSFHSDDGKAPSQSGGDTKPAFLVQVNKRCGIDRYGWRTDADLRGARSQQGLLAMTNFSLPPKADGARYSGVARDERGTYRYNAKLMQTPNGSMVASRKVRYQRKAGLNTDAKVSQRVTGTGLQVALEPGGWFRRASLAESREIGPGLELLAKSDIKLTVDLTTEQPDAIAVDLDDGHWLWGDLFDSVAASMKGQLPVDAKLVGIPFEAFLAKVAQMKRGGAGVAETIGLLAAWMRANPGQLGKVKSWLLEEGTASDQSKSLSRTLLAALGDAGLPRARAVLRELALDPNYHTALRVDAALNLATARNFDGKDMDALLKLSGERLPPDPGSNLASYPAASGTALLGAAAKKLREEGATELADKAIAALQQKLAAEQDIEFQKGAIIGAGNSGDPKLLTAMKPYIQHADTDLRLEAADALRLMPFEETADTFAQWLGEEKEANVKQALVHAMWIQSRASEKAPPDTVVDAALQQFAQPQQDAVLSELVLLLGTAAKTHKGARVALVTLFQAELAKGAAANAELLSVIGRFLDAATLMGK
jgi:hypothetical protein